MKVFLGIQARLNSRRLPNKVLKKVNGNPILFYVLERLKKTKLKNKIYVLTSLEQCDSRIVNYCKKKKINFFRGNLNDVFSRYVEFTKIKKLDAVIRISADSPLIDFNLVNSMYELFLQNSEYDVITNIFPRTFPVGQSVEILRSSTLEFMNQKILDLDDKEHVTSYIYKNPKLFKILNYKNTKNENSLRLSIDNEQDFKTFINFVKVNKNFLDYNLSKIIETWRCIKKN